MGCSCTAINGHAVACGVLGALAQIQKSSWAAGEHMLLTDMAWLALAVCSEGVCLDASTQPLLVPGCLCYFQTHAVCMCAAPRIVWPFGAGLHVAAVRLHCVACDMCTCTCLP